MPHARLGTNLLVNDNPAGHIRGDSEICSVRSEANLVPPGP